MFFSLFSKKLLYSVLILLFIGTLWTFVSKYNSVRNTLNAEHNRYKEFLYLLKVAEKPPTFKEDKVKKFITSLGAKLKSVSKLGNSYKFEIDNLRAEKLPFLLKELEKYGTIEEFKAVDNTGKGNFYVKLTLKVRNL
jgi:hypothetical protein